MSKGTGSYPGGDCERAVFARQSGQYPWRQADQFPLAAFRGWGKPHTHHHDRAETVSVAAVELKRPMFLRPRRWFNRAFVFSIKSTRESSCLSSLLSASSSPAALVLVASLSWFFSAQAQQPDPLGSVDRYYIPIPAPSADTSVRSLVMNGQRYNIPRNFIFSLENKDDGNPGAISLRALLPNLVGLANETLDCLNPQNACHEKIVTVGLTDSTTVVPGSKILENMKPLVMPEQFIGPCGLHFYESIGNESQRFRYFFKKMAKDADISVLRCAKETSSYAPTCVSENNPIDRITFYYNFNRKFLCEWEDIRDKIRSRITSFRAEPPK